MFDTSFIIILLTLGYFIQIFNDYKKRYMQFSSTEHENINLKNKFNKFSIRYRKLKQENSRLKSEIKFLEKQAYLQHSRLEHETQLRKSVEAKSNVPFHS